MKPRSFSPRFFAVAFFLGAFSLFPPLVAGPAFFYDSRAEGNDFDGKKTLAAIGFTDAHGGVASFRGGNLVLTPDDINGGLKANARDFVLREDRAEQVRDIGCRVTLPPNFRAGNAALGLLLRFGAAGSGLLLSFLPETRMLSVSSLANGVTTLRASVALTGAYVAANPLALEARVFANAATALTVTDLKTGKIIGYLDAPLDFGVVPAGGFGLVPWMTAPGRGQIQVASVQTYPVRGVMCEGDSLTAGENDSRGKGTASPLARAYPGVLQKLLGNRYHVFNLGRGGYTLTPMNGDSDRRVDAVLAPAEQPPIVILEGGTNDFGIDGSLKPPVSMEQAVKTVYARLQTYWAARHAARPDTTVIDVTNTPAQHPAYVSNLGSATGFNQRRNALNDLRRKAVNSTVGPRPDFLADDATDLRIGRDGAEANATYFAGQDKTHLTEAGYAIKAAIIFKTIERHVASLSVPPPPPLKLFARPISGREIDLFWNDAANNESGYEVFASLDPKNFPATPSATVPANATYHPVTGLKAGATYYFQVRARNAAGISAASGATATTGARTPAVDFTGGFGAAGSSLAANGFGNDSPFVGSVLRLIDGRPDETRSVWFRSEQSLSRFSTEFTFRVTKAAADGFTFALQRVGPAALGGSGGNFGSQGLATSAAIKFDFFPNLSTTGLYLNGAAPDDNSTPTAASSGAIDVTSAGIDFHAGPTFRVTLSYDGATLTETISDLSTRASFTHSYRVDLAGVLGGPSAYVGFTGGAGGLSAVVDILSWSLMIPLSDEKAN